MSKSSQGPERLGKLRIKEVRTKGPREELGG
jgi:hypothetical protein